jgi:hypothetical protein
LSQRHTIFSKTRSEFFKSQTLGGDECKIQAGIVNARIKNFKKKFRRTVNRSSQTRNLIELPLTSPNLRERRGIHRNSETRAALNSPELHAIGSHSVSSTGVLLIAAPLVQLEKSEGLFVDLAHRN